MVFKKLKLSIFFFFILVLFVLNAETYQKHLDTFESDFSYIMYVSDDEEEHRLFYNDLCKISQAMGTSLFSVSGKYDNQDVLHICIYADEEATSLLKEQYHIKEGAYKSWFSGKAVVQFRSMEEGAEESHLWRYNIIGEKNTVKAVRNEINNIYGVSLLKKDSAVNDRWIVLLEWLALLVFVLLMTLFDISFQKKEAFVRISLGASPVSIVCKNILLDVLGYIGGFGLQALLLRKHMFIGFNFELILIMMFMLIVFNSLLYVPMLKYDTKKALSKGNFSESFCGNCYIIKVFTMILAILSIASNIIVIMEGVSFINQSKNIYKFEGYSFLELKKYRNSDMGYEQYNELIGKIYYENYEKYDVAYSVINFEIGDIDYIMVNDKAKEVIEPLLKKYPIEEQVEMHFLVPEEVNLSKEEIESLIDYFSMMGIKGDSYEVIAYDESERVLYFDENLELQSEYSENPIVLYSLVAPSADLEDLNIGHVFRDIMFRVNDQDLNELDERYQLEEKGYYLTRANVLERYEQYKKRLVRTITVNSTISFIIMTFEIAVILTIIRLEYNINAMELSIKKLLGYGVWKRNKRIVLTIVYTILLSTVTIIIASMMFDLATLCWLLAAGIVLGILELLLVWHSVNVIERSDVVKILKGGAL